MAPRPSPQTERVVRLMEVLAADPGAGLSLAEVARRLGVHKASCHSMLSELVRSGWLLRDPTRKTYQLGPSLVRLGTAAASRFPALDLARPAMADLSNLSGGHCIAFAVGDDHVTVVDQVRSPQDTGHPMAIGTELPSRPPYGATLAAWLPTEQRDAWLSAVPRSAGPHYRKALASASQKGYAVGLHVLNDVRLQELAALIRGTETRRGRLSDLAAALTEELMLSEEWFPASISPTRQYDVSHVDSPVIGPDGAPVLILSLVPVPSRISGSETIRLGTLLTGRTKLLSEALKSPEARVRL